MNFASRLGALTFTIAMGVNLTSSALASADKQRVPMDMLSPTIGGVDPTQWRYMAAYSDEFNDRRLNNKKWQNDPDDWGPWSWKKRNTKLKDGKLLITLDYKEHKAVRPSPKGPTKVDLFYESGIVRSKRKTTYGYYEARIKGVPTFPGSSPAFWLYSIGENAIVTRQKPGQPVEETQVIYSEVDIIEMQQAEGRRTSNKRDDVTVLDMNLHTRIIDENGNKKWMRPGMFPELTRNKMDAEFDPSKDFHIYGAEVTPESITWYLDGKPVFTKDNKYWHLPMHVTLSLGLRWPHVTYRDCPNGMGRCPVPSAATEDGYPTTMEVDWVRSYTRLPAN